MNKVIINGIDVSGCPFYQYQTEEDYEMRYPESGYCEIGLAGYLFNYSRITEEIEKDCIDNPNCYYKQLKRLKEQIIRLSEEEGNLIIKANTSYNNYRDTQRRLNELCKANIHNLALLSKANKTLQEIREIADENKDTAQYRGICNSILEKVNEALGAE